MYRFEFDLDDVNRGLAGGRHAAEREHLARGASDEADTTSPSTATIASRASGTASTVTRASGAVSSISGAAAPCGEGCTEDTNSAHAA